MFKEKSALISPQFFAGRTEFSHWLLHRAEQIPLFAPDLNLRLRLFKPEQVHSLRFNRARVLDPIKSLFFPIRAKLGSAFLSVQTTEPKVSERIILGVKACDLGGLEILDYVFLGGEAEEENYRLLREKTIIISSDCTEPSEFCFCLALGGSVYPDSGFDLNLTPVKEGWVIAVGSQKGQKLMREAGFRPANELEYEAKLSLRAQVEENFSSWLSRQGWNFKEMDFQKILSLRREDPLWKETAEQCVECGACSFICPSCHCFSLSDKELNGEFVRYRTWDSCQYPGFARRAGGANSCRGRDQRLRNRYEKKFSFFMAKLGRYGCVGCGRCISACAGGIDLREVLKELCLEQSLSGASG